MTSVFLGMVAFFALGVAPIANSLVELAPDAAISATESLSQVSDGAKFGLLAQGDVVGTETPTASAPTESGTPPAKRPEDMTLIERIFASGIILPVGLVVLFYAIFLAPERRRKAEEAKLMAGLKKNDRVVTIGGIHGTVANVTTDSDIVTLKVDESTGTRIRVNRSAIARIVSDPASGDKDATADDTAK